MAKYSRLSVLNEMINIGLVPVFYHHDPTITEHIIKACLDGGVRCFEFTNRGDGAFQVFSEIVNRFKDDDRLILGAGTIRDYSTAALFIQLGANFIVGPNFNSDVSKICNSYKISYCPGCASVNEIAEAEKSGVEICKIFPGSCIGGPNFIKNVLGPMPWSRLMPTGGVDVNKDNVTDWIKSGASCLGIGSSLFKKEIINNEDYSSITRMVISLIDWIKDARLGKNPIS